jgi:hypothetical protein
LRESAAIGTSTNHAQVQTVNPSVRPKPGSGLDLPDLVQSQRIVKIHIAKAFLKTDYAIVTLRAQQTSKKRHKMRSGIPSTFSL